MVCRLSVMSAIPGTVIIVFGAGLVATWSDRRPAMLPPTMLEVPLTVPVLGSKLHDDVTTLASRCTRGVRSATTCAMVDDALVASAVSVTRSVVRMLPRLMCASVTGEVPGDVASATEATLIRPVAFRP
jgi:hypothetical protein